MSTPRGDTMETGTVGRVLVTAKIENLEDVYLARRGLIRSEDVRAVDVTDALVDTGATVLSLPPSLIQKLGLSFLRTRQARTSAGPVRLNVYDGVRLTIHDRQCLSDVMGVPDDCPVLIGQIPLEALDFVVSPSAPKLIGNPEHGGEHMVDLY